MNRPLLIVNDALAIVKKHAQAVPEYLQAVFSDDRGEPLRVNRVDLLAEARKILSDVDTSRPLNVTFADQLDEQSFPILMINEAVTANTAEIGSGVQAPSGLPYGHDGETGEVGFQISRASVTATVWSDRVAETTILSHLFFCGLQGMRTQLSLRGLSNVRLRRESARRVFGNYEDLYGVLAETIVVEGDFGATYPMIDRFYPDVTGVRSEGTPIEWRKSA